MVSTVASESALRGFPVLAAVGLSKRFGGVHALEDMSMDVFPGEVVAIVGDNGAGKSTFLKVISGVYRPSSGQIFVDGEEVEFDSPARAREIGIETIYQDLSLVDDIDVTGNFFLGRELLSKNPLSRLFGHLRLREMRKHAREGIDELHIDIPRFDSMLVRNMSGGQRQAVAIARGVIFGRKLVMLDEPTAALGVEETGEVKRLIRHLSDNQGLPIIVISHNLQDVFDISSRIVVFRHGKKVADLVTANSTPQDVIAHITGVAPEHVPGVG